MFACYIYRKVVICPSQDSMGNVGCNQIVSDVLMAGQLLPTWSMLGQDITNYRFPATLSHMLYNFSNTEKYKIKYNL
jgi:hypothetical protein